MGKEPIRAKWIFKQKTTTEGEVMPKARFVAKGYTQIEGLDYQEAFAPVVNEVTSRIVFGIGLKRQYSTKVYDVDAAFLNGDL